mgnify:CR=1 FL=1
MFFYEYAKMEVLLQRGVLHFIENSIIIRDRKCFKLNYVL